MTSRCQEALATRICTSVSKSVPMDLAVKRMLRSTVCLCLPKKSELTLSAEKLNAVCFPFFDKQSENFSCSFLAFQDQHADSLFVSFDQFNLVTGLEGGLCRLSVKMCSA